MRFSLQREVFLKALTQVINVVERRHTLPVLSNLLVQIEGGKMSLTATDMEVEMISHVDVEDAEDGEITIPARKLFDLVRALPDGSKITVKVSGDRVNITSGRSRYVLSTLPSLDFPSIDEFEATEQLEVPESALRELIDRTAFAMASQDVRFYLNGLLLDLRPNSLRCVATDGHRLALCEHQLEHPSSNPRQIIIPRKGVQELQRLLEGGDRVLRMQIGRGHIRVERDDLSFTSKLIDGKFPDYEVVLPIGADQLIRVDRELLRASLQRAAILANDKYKGVRLEVTKDQLKVSSNNPDPDEAQEEISVDTIIEDLAMGFNVVYLLDALTSLKDEEVIIAVKDASSSALIREATNERCRHVVMPLRL